MRITSDKKPKKGTSKAVVRNGFQICYYLLHDDDEAAGIWKAIRK
jgi:hypothetical protein